MALGWHVTMRLESGSVLFRGVAERRRAARTVLRLGEGRGLFAFHAPDGHLHLGVAADRASVGRFVQALAVGLGPMILTGERWEPARIRPIESQSHLNHAVRYILNQANHHGAVVDPLAEASNLPDLLEMRTVGAYTRERVRELVPRLRKDELWEMIRVSPVEPCCDTAVLADAAAASVAWGALASSGREVRAARVAAMDLARGIVRREELDRVLRVSRATGTRLRAERPDEMLRAAIARQCAVRRALGAAAGPEV